MRVRERERRGGGNKEIKGANRGRKIIKAEFGEEKSGGGGGEGEGMNLDKRQATRADAVD